MKIGDVVFRHSQVCDRCVFTTVDPDLGDKNAGSEPLKTLRKFRCAEFAAEKQQFGSSPFFGVNMAVEVPGQIMVGNKVFVGKYD